ncbi:aquaporin [Candidatus Peribacteria bacterium]|nr:MAG: aquaporin [Candidatus Peribacteria bacterium]
MKKSAISSRACVAEFLGTFLLATGVGVTIGIPGSGVPTAVLAGLILGTMVYSIGAISGAHINPAVTVSLFSVGKIKAPAAISYILSQLLGGGLALLLQMYHFPFTLEQSMDNMALTAVGEIIGTFILVWGICSVVYGKVQDSASGLTIGASLTIGAIIASIGSYGVLNPAVAAGLGIFAPVYLLAPFVGGVLAAQLYRWTANGK